MNTSFERNSKKDEWLTPPEIISKLGVFDLDPCSPINRPWATAKTHFNVNDDGLQQKWFGRVWCNPPYGTQTKKWLHKCVEHGNCLVFIFARTDTKMFFDYVWSNADALLFLKGRVSFCNVQGVKQGTAGAPSVLIAYGRNNAEILKNSGLSGAFFPLR